MLYGLGKSNKYELDKSIEHELDKSTEYGLEKSTEYIARLTHNNEHKYVARHNYCMYKLTVCVIITMSYNTHTRP